MATGIHSAEQLPDADYSISHRTPPPIPSAAYSHAHPSTPPLPLNQPGRPGYVNEAGSVNTEHRRRGSFGLRSLSRSSSSQGAQLQQSGARSSNSEDVPPVPPVPATRIAQAHQQAASSGNRKTSGEGRNMLRKTSRMRAREEQERVEHERQERLRAPPPKLPSHNPLPGIATFGGEDVNTTTVASNGRSNFSRPGNAFAMPGNKYNSSSSPAYAVRPSQQPSSSPPSRANGEYVSDSVERSESMTNRGRYSYASSTVPVNTSSPRRIRRRKDPTPLK